MTHQPAVGDDLSDWPPPTAPTDVSICLRGFANEDQAKEFGARLASTIRMISGVIDLGRLDGVTVGFDYDEALSSVDRGKEGLRPLSRSDGEIIGIAMAPAVLRDGVVKVHLVFAADHIAGLMADDGAAEDYRLALAVIAHECAHVEVTTDRDLAFPGTILRSKYDTWEAEIFGQNADICWEEYAACRRAAVFSSAKSGDFAEALATALKVARERCDAAIRSYRWHADINKVVNEAGTPLCQPLKLASYLLGHLDGCNEGWDAAAEARKSVEDSGYAPMIDQMHEQLRQLWTPRGKWQSADEFKPLSDVVRSSFAFGGLYFEPGPTPDSGRVNIPFTPATMG